MATLALSASACSGSDDAPHSEPSSAESAARSAELKPETPATSSRFKALASQAELAAAWPHGFDRHPDYLEATVMALGNVRISADGPVTISPTPALLASGKPLAPGWDYTFELAEVGRDRIGASPGKVQGSVLEAGRAHLDYADGVRVTLDHQPGGLKLFTVLEERPAGEGHLRVGFAHGGSSSAAMNAKGELEVSHGDAPVFSWSGVVAFDATGREVPVKLQADAKRFWFEVDDRQAAYPLTIDPLASAPSWEHASTQPNSAFGASLSQPHDVNGDGIVDVAVGQPNYSITYQLQGRVLVFLGSSNGFGNTAGFTVVGDAQFEQLGVGMTLNGDTNGDGCHELLLGSPGHDQGFGRVLMFEPYTCATQQLNPSPLVWSKVADVRAGLGASLDVGDFNCDGEPDLLVGAPSSSADDGEGGVVLGAGAVEVYLSNPSGAGFLSSAAYRYQDPEFGLQLGSGVVTLSNARGRTFSTPARCDGFAASSPFANGNRGRVYVFDVSSQGDITTSPIQLEGSQTNGWFGVSMEAMPSPNNTQINGQRIDALVVGAGGRGNPGPAGSVFIYEWDTAAGSYEQVWSASGPHAGSRFGHRVATNGDYNNDGHLDLAVGAYQLRNEQNVVEGGAMVFLGSPNGLRNTPDWTQLSGQAGSEFGISVRGVPDITGDGNDELLVGARSYDGLIANGGQIFMYPGRANCFIGGSFYSEGEANPDNGCELCNPAQSTSAWSNAADGLACGDEGDSCTVATCQAGQCTGTQIDCDDGNPCTQDSCDPVEGCVYETAPRDGQTCEDDGLSCTSNICEDGACTHPVTSGCLISGSCFPAGATNPSAECFVCDPQQSTTSWSPKAAGSSCDNGLFCTINDTCNAVGQCEAGEARVCDTVQCYGGVVCSNAARACVPTQPQTGTACDDGSLCTTGETCQAGTCVAGEVVDCSAQSGACTVGVCNPATGACESEPLANGSACDTGDACTSGVCESGVCQAGAPLDCDDNNPCTVGSCDSAEGCVYAPVSDGLSCQAPFCQNETELVGAGQCVSGACAAGVVVDCAPFLCESGACTTLCESDAECSEEAYCNEVGECSTENRAPEADAGANQSVGSEAEVTLDGTASSDPDGDELTFAWTQLEGPAVDLDDATSAAPMFVAPALEAGEEIVLIFELVVSDGEFDSEPDTTEVRVTNDENRPPVARIEGPSEASAGETILLDGAGSSDPDGDAIDDYRWSLVQGQPLPTISQTDRDSAVNVTFPTTISEVTTYRFGLIVSDGMANSPREVHEVVVEPIDIPVDPEPDAGDDVGDDVGTDAGDDVGFDAGADAGVDADQPQELRGSLAGSGCACSSSSQQGDSGFFLFAAALGLMWWRRREAGL